MKLLVDYANYSHTEIGEFPCVSCYTNCSKAYVMLVNAHDIYRFFTQLDLAPESFLEIYGVKNYSLEVEIEKGLIDLALKQKMMHVNF